MVLTVEEKVQIVVWHVNGLSDNMIRQQFVNMFPNRPALARSTIQSIIRNFFTYGSVFPPRGVRTRRGVNPDLELRDILICTSIEQNPTQSTSRLGEQYGISRFRLMLENGKHVLCEKPFTMNEKQTKKLLDISKEKNLFLMEAVWSRCFPAYDKMIEVIKSGEIGEVVQVTVEFGVPISHVDRVKNKDLGGGVILDLGVYILQFQQYVFNGLKPTKIVASGHLNEEGIDSSVAAILTFPEGKTAVLSASSFTKLACEGVVYGTKGCIKMPTFWCPTTLDVNGVVLEFPLIKNEGEFNYLNSAGLAYEAEEARQCIMKNKIESPKITHDNTLELAQLMDKLRAELGVVFPADGESY
ncbi:trans-1,2-dihydrobenzene-1,2-diol dehydrogenase-like isoform X1 [Diabrotica undecimpunctata]|uniref:trans-1,2-dihydrobenzene-1,2-diol dehydrogenase-like isoform X1 n=1 Tax=Diabrotica undecimpunctata TaxID=50387 RepID=UPI003B6424F3